MSSDFLINEYNMCFDQMKHYDDMQLDILKFSIGLSSTIFTALLAIYKLSSSHNSYSWAIISAICLATSLGIFLLSWKMVKNRLYFVFPARQVNAIRKYLIQKEEPNFMEFNKMYLSVDFSAAKLLSTHMIMIFGTNILSGIFVSAGLISLSAYFYSVSTRSVLIGGLIAFLLILSNQIAILIYLTLKSHKSGDEAVHNKNK